MQSLEMFPLITQIAHIQLVLVIRNNKLNGVCVLLSFNTLGPSIERRFPYRDIRDSPIGLDSDKPQLDHKPFQETPVSNNGGSCRQQHLLAHPLSHPLRSHAHLHNEQSKLKD